MRARLGMSVAKRSAASELRGYREQEAASRAALFLGEEEQTAGSELLSMHLVNAEPRKFTNDELTHLYELGTFGHERVELIEGVIVHMSP